MVEIGGKTILWHIMKHYLHFGFNDFILALGYKGNDISDYFKNYYIYNSDFTIHLSEVVKVSHHNNCIAKDWTLTLVETGTDSMISYRVKIAGKYITDDHFMITYGDAVSNVNLMELYDFHLKNKFTSTVTGVYPSSRFGDLVTKGNKVTHFYEKV